MKIQVTALVLLVATLAACDAAPVEETSPPPGPFETITGYARKLTETTRGFFESVSSNPTVQGGREWISTQMESLSGLIQSKREQLSQRLQQLTGQDNEQ